MSFYFNQTNLTPGTKVSGASNFPQGLTIGTAGQGGFVAGISSLNAELDTTATGYAWIPQYFKFRPDQAAKGGLVANVLEWDAVDTGANYALVLAANSDNAIISAVWPGYISMPLTLTGATVALGSDNETFLYGDGNGGSLGTLSTGTPFLSASNAFSSILAPGGQKANVTALFSTFQNLYPACFS